MLTNKQNTFLRQRFDQLARRYRFNPFTYWVGRSELAALREMIPPSPQPGITPALDFGCGTGRVTSLLLNAGYRATGYDLSPGMLEQARAATGQRSDVCFTSNPEVVKGPWPLIVALGVLDYYPDSSPLWQEWKQLLSPGGSIVATIPNALSPLAKLYTLFSRFTYQAYTTKPMDLSSIAWSRGFLLKDMKFTFPSHWWGHTVVFSFQT